MKPGEVLTRNIAEVLPSKKALEARLKRGPIKIYHGIDPSSPEIHLGHAVVLWKLKEFQELGHKVILLIGDFTGMIGDPSDQALARKKMTRKQVLENTKTYKEQIGKILQFGGKNPAEIKFNSEWLSKLSFQDVLELASLLTAQQILERDFFQERMKKKKSIWLHEFLYPLMQGYDSVAMEVDAEIGGTDQTFNMLVGRTLLKRLKGKEKFVISTPLLEGLDGRKMSKSYGNFIAITEEPDKMFGKIMSLQDNLVPRYLELATQLAAEELQSIKQQLQSNKLHPMQAKKMLAKEIVKLYHGEKKATGAQKEFEKVFQEGEAPKTAPVYKAREKTIDLPKVLTSTGLVESKSQARRLLDQGGVEWKGKKVKGQTLKVDTSGTLKVGKHRFLKIKP